MGPVGELKTPSKDGNRGVGEGGGAGHTPTRGAMGTPTSGTSTPGSGGHTPMSERQQLALLRHMEEEGGRGEWHSRELTAMTMAHS